MKYLALALTLLPLFAQAEEKSLAAIGVVRLQPEQPKIGERIAAVLQLHTELERKEIAAKFYLGSVPLLVESQSKTLFLANINPFTEVKKDQNLRVEIFTRDAKKAARLQGSILKIKQEIRALDQEIANETDPQRIAELEAVKNQKNLFLQQAEQQLEGLNKYFQTIEKPFTVAADPQNLDYPYITTITPDAVITGKRTKIKIFGERFGLNPTVKMGDQNATLLNASATEIEVLGPNFSTAGLKEVELRFPADGATPKKNAVKSDSLFATSVGVLQNLRPVAVTTGYVRAIWPVLAPVQLTGTNSYDENGDTLTFQWEVVASPAGSVYPAGTLLADSPTPSITPDKLGLFRVRLRMKETNTEQELQSFPSIVTIEVK